MIKKATVLILVLICNLGFAKEIYDASWCQKNGGKIEYQSEHNVSLNCVAYEFNNPVFSKKIYNILCIPLYSAVLENRPPRFLKIVSDLQNYSPTVLDEFNFETAKDELIRYI